MRRIILMALVLAVTVAGCNRFPDLSVQITANLAPDESSCSISPEQEAELLRLICNKTPDQLKMSTMIMCDDDDGPGRGSRLVEDLDAGTYILFVDGYNEEGSFELSTVWTEGEETTTVEGKKLRFSMPAALCSYCLGETRIGSDYQMGNVRKMELEMPTGLKNDGAPGAPEAPGGSE